MTNFRAPGERQAAAAGLYSGAMMMLSPYRPAATARRDPSSDAMGPESAAAAALGAEIYLNRAIYASRRGVSLKKWNFVWVLSNSSPAIASPFAPGGSLSSPCRLPLLLPLAPIPSCFLFFDLCALCVFAVCSFSLFPASCRCYCPWLPFPLAFSSLIFATLASWRFALFLFSLPTATATATAAASLPGKLRLQAVILLRNVNN